MNEEIEKIKKAKENGKSIGLVQGSWDLFHIGHLKYLKKARELCDFLVVAMDSDEKIKSRKGTSRPIIPEKERFEFISLLDIADSIIIKRLNEPKWNLIKTIKPDVLVAIKENYKKEELEELKQFCKKIAILPRQSETSTSDKIRKIIISEKKDQLKNSEKKLKKAIDDMKMRIGYNDNLQEPIPMLIDNLKNSTDYVCPVSACCYWNGKWNFGANHIDFSIPKSDIDKRTELYYSCVEHAELDLLKKLGDVTNLDSPLYTTLFPCDKCMKVLIDKGIKEIFYLEDHPNRNWSKRSHELAEKKGIKVIKIDLLKNTKLEPDLEKPNMMAYKYIYPPNVRFQEQLDIMMDFEAQDKDPLDPEYIEQEILYKTNYWYISKNRFPYEGVEFQFLIATIKPVFKIEDISSKMWEELLIIWEEISKTYNLKGGALCFRYGNPAYSGSSLKRLHAHIIIPKENEKTKFSIGGRTELKKELKLRRNYE